MKSDCRRPLQFTFSPPLQFTFPPSPRASATPLRSSAVLPLARCLSPSFSERRGRAADIKAAILKRCFTCRFCAYKAVLLPMICAGSSSFRGGAEKPGTPVCTLVSARAPTPLRPRLYSVIYFPTKTILLQLID